MADIHNDQPDRAGETAHIELTAEIISAYVSNNNIAPAQVPDLIKSVGAALKRQHPQPEPQQPAVAIRRSVQPDAITCLECGKKFKSLRRHIGNEHGLEPAEYRQKWGLPADYPMAAPNYSEQRSAMAKSMGLGRKSAETASAAKGSRKRGAKAKAEAPAA